DWSSDVCSSDLERRSLADGAVYPLHQTPHGKPRRANDAHVGPDAVPPRGKGSGGDPRGASADRELGQFASGRRSQLVRQRSAKSLCLFPPPELREWAQVNLVPKMPERRRNG